MDTCMHRAESVPARRTKSWKREHQQTCTRRFQSTNSRAQQQQKQPSDLLANVVWELPQPGSGTPTRNYNYNYCRRPLFRDFSSKFTTSQQYFRRSSSKYSFKNNYGFYSGNKKNDSCEIESERDNLSVLNKVSSLNYPEEIDSILNKSDFGGSFDSLNRDRQDRIELLSSFYGTVKPQYVTNSKVNLETSFPVSVAIDNVVKCVEMRGLLTKEGQCIRIKTCEEIESSIYKKQCCIELVTQDFPIPKDKRQDCALIDDYLSVDDISMASEEMEYVKDMQDQDYPSLGMSKESNCDKTSKGQCPENQEEDVFQANSGLSPRCGIAPDSNFAQIKLLELEQHKKLHVSNSLMNIEANKCKITTESRSKDSILGNNCLSGHVGVCSYSHNCLISNGLVGYMLGQDRLVEVITVTHNDKLVESEGTDPDRQELSNYISETKQRISIKIKLRSINRNVARQRPEEEYFTRLDPSVKKNTAFVRRLKTFTISQLNGFLKDMSSLNLTKYISEVAAAMVESKLKMADVWPAVQLCNIFHQTYSEFSTYLLDNWHKVLTMKKDEQISNQAKLRVDLRFYAELISVGIFTCKEGLPLLGNILTILTHLDKEDHYNIKIILSFCRHCGDDYAGLIPRRLRLLSEKYDVTVPQYKLLSEEKQRNVKTLLNDYYNSLCKHLLKEHLTLQELTKQNRKILQTRGELGLERKDRLEAVQVSYKRITSATQQLAEVLDKDFPLLPEDESLKIANVESEEGVIANDLWGDEETRCFYECFPDMKEFVPSFQVKMPDPEPQVSEETLDIEFEGDLASETAAEDDAICADDDDEPESTDCKNNKMLLEAFLATLSQCINQDMIDKAAVKFVTTLNTKHNRKKLVRALFNVSRVRLDLLPFYARFVTIVHAISPDVATDLAQILKQDFKYHVRKKDQLNIESKIKVVRFIGELVKFRMYSKVEGLYCLKVLVKDFTHHHIEMCCNFLETCGRFFFRHPDCYQRMKIYLDQIMRKKAVMALDPRYVTMIENAYYSVNPPEGIQCIHKERPEDHEFIRKVLYQDLAKTNVDEVLCLMLKLDWDEPDTVSYAIKCLTYAFKVKYLNICCLASLLAGLVVEREFVGTQVIDSVLEDIQLGMEVNLPKYNQRRVAMIKYLGELYNYRMVENSNIFQVLYSLITFGITWDHTIESPLDPPENVFRIRLICILLDTCGDYFVSGSSKMKLDVYLIFFQYYYWFKFSHPYWCMETPFPIHIIYMFQDTVTRLRPNIHVFISLGEAKDAVNKFCLEQESSIDVQCETYESDNMTGNSDNDETLDYFKDDIAEDHNGSSEVEHTTQENFNGSLNNVVDVSSLKDSCFNEDVEEMEIDEDYAGSLCETEDSRAEWNTVNGDLYSKSETSNQQENVTPNSDKCSLLHRPALVECPEDEEFLSAFDRMVSDNIQNRMHEAVKPQQLDISVPLHIRGITKKTYNMLREETATKETTKSIVNFVLMLRKGHKQQYKNLVVPVNSEMALNLKNYEEAERAEKEHVKRLTLNINERLEEEDYQEMLAQTQRPIMMNLNRERRPKYQHLKGVPDSDLFFCSKKVR